MPDNYDWPVAKKFFITGGRASGETPKGTMQEALVKARINGCNLLYVSSVLDPDAAEIEIPVIPHAAMAKCVMAEEKGTEGESIAAGIAIAYMCNRDATVRKAYVVEDHGHKEERAVEETLYYSLIEMAEGEKLQIFNRAAPDERLLMRKEWYELCKKEGRDFPGWSSPEHEYKKYLRANADKFFKKLIKGIDKIDKDFGYCAAALVYVFESNIEQYVRDYVDKMMRAPRAVIITPVEITPANTSAPKPDGEKK